MTTSVIGGRRIQRSVWTKWVMIAFHMLFVVSWWLPGVNLFGSLLVWFVLQLGVHLGYHRYFAHASFKTCAAFELLMACVGCLAFQNGPLWWASKHRHHHRASDTDADHHSPNSGFWHAHIGWLLSKKADEVDLRLIPDLLRPVPLWVERHQRALHLLYVSSLVLIFGWPALLALWIVPIVLCWHTTFATNSICHRFGSRPFASWPRGSCSARNNAIVAIVNLGEGWHNNHHAHPGCSHHGFYRWYQWDIVYIVLLLLARVRVVWALK